MVTLIKKGYNAVKELVSPKQHNPFKLLLIGETGSGKTSFLNLICNFDLIVQLGGFETSVDHFQNFNVFALENAEKQKMESKTSNAKLYNVNFFDLKVGIIDTPGFGDSRGIEEDERHVKKIIATLKEVDYVNCVCLVVNGRNSRMTSTLRYVLTEITTILPKTILDNVIVVFTNTGDPLDLNFDLSALKGFFGKEITTHFCIENPYCKFEKAKVQQEKKNLPIQTIAKSLKKGFEETGEVLKEMYSAIKPFKPVHTKYFTELYEKKQEIEKTVLELLVSYDNQIALEAAIKKLEEQVQAAIDTKKLNNNFQTTQMISRWVSKDTRYHNTLCSYPDCYSTCHEECTLEKSHDKKVIKNCWAIDGETCRVCHHSYKSHFHNEVKMEKITETKEIIDENMKRKFLVAKSTEERAALLRSSLNSQKKLSERKRKEVSTQLLLTIEEFHQLGLNRNYAKVLENQLYVVEQRLQADDGAAKDALRDTQTELKKKLELVQRTMLEPWSPQADQATRKNWAYKVMMLDVEMPLTKRELEKSFRQLSLQAHPDKGGDDEEFKKLKLAYDIVRQYAK